MHLVGDKLAEPGVCGVPGDGRHGNDDADCVVVTSGGHVGFPRDHGDPVGLGKLVEEDGPHRGAHP